MLVKTVFTRWIKDFVIYSSNWVQSSLQGTLFKSFSPELYSAVWCETYKSSTICGFGEITDCTFRAHVWGEASWSRPGTRATAGVLIGARWCQLNKWVGWPVLCGWALKALAICWSYGLLCKELSSLESCEVLFNFPLQKIF